MCNKNLDNLFKIKYHHDIREKVDVELVDLIFK